MNLKPTSEVIFTLADEQGNIVAIIRDKEIYRLDTPLRGEGIAELFNGGDKLPINRTVKK